MIVSSGCSTVVHIVPFDKESAHEKYKGRIVSDSVQIFNRSIPEIIEFEGQDFIVPDAVRNFVSLFETKTGFHIWRDSAHGVRTYEWRDARFR